MASTEDRRSVYPPTKYLTFGPWMYLVPQYKPKSVLMLGYAGGTAAGLIRLLYGDGVQITGVDIEGCEPSYGVVPIKADAKEFVKTCGHYDTVIVDVFENHGVPDFVLEKEFVTDIEKITDYIIVNTLKNPNMSAYRHLRRLAHASPPGLSNIIYYYEINPIKDIHLYRALI